MSRVTIETPKDSKLEDIEQLPDRSELTKLYFKPVNNPYAGVLPEPKKHISKKDFKTLVQRTTVFVGIVAVTPFIFIELALNILLQINGGSSIQSIIILFPASMAAILLLWILSASRTAITDRLGDIGVSTSFVILYLYFCLAMIVWPIYRFTNATNGLLLQQVLIFAAMSTVGIYITHSLLSLIDNETSSNISKMFSLIAPITLCFIICLIGII